MSAGLGEGAAAVVHGVVGLGAVLVLPLGLRLAGPRLVPRPGSVLWPVAGAGAAVAVWLPVGPVATVLVVPFALATFVLLGAAARLLVRPPAPRRGDAASGSAVEPPLPSGVRRLALAVALGTPAVGAAALVAERAGRGLLGFEGDYLTLTVPHMLFAGFGACLVAALVAPRTAVRPERTAAVLGDIAAVAVPVGVLLVLGGYFVSDAAELVGAAALTVALWCAAGAVLVDAGHVGSRTARLLLRVGAGVVLVAMVPALWWAVGEATGVPHPGLDVMVVTHGVANALGFVGATLVALRLASHDAAEPSTSTRRGGPTYAEVGATLRGVHPDGYRRTRVRRRVASSATPARLTALGDALLGWRVHAAAGVPVDADGPAAPGVRATSRPGVGPVRLVAPCVVVGVERTADRRGFAYGTLHGHPFRGEERFGVERGADGGLWFTVDAFSVPDRAWVRAAGPLVGVGQRVYAWRLAGAARRLVRAADGIGAGER